MSKDWKFAYEGVVHSVTVRYANGSSYSYEHVRALRHSSLIERSDGTQVDLCSWNPVEVTHHVAYNDDKVLVAVESGVPVLPIRCQMCYTWKEGPGHRISSFLKPAFSHMTVCQGCYEQQISEARGGTYNHDDPQNVHWVHTYPKAYK